jgi:hypothetical protein
MSHIQYQGEGSMSKQEIQKCVEQLDQQRLALLDQLAELDEAALQEKPKPDDWSTIGIAEHLMMSESFMLEGLPDPATLKPKKQPLKASMMYPVANFVLNRNISVAPPPGGTPSEKMTLDEIRQKWDKSQAWIQTFLDQHDAPTVQQPLVTHPIFGPIATLKLFTFMQTHFDYHNRQIQKRVG